MSCPPRFSQGLFFCMRYVRKRSYFSLLLACRTIRRIRWKFLWVPSIACVFCCPFHGLLFHPRTSQFVFLCLTAVHGALDRRHHRCASGTRSSTRCCSRAVAIIGLQIREQIVDVPVPQIMEEIVEIVCMHVNSFFSHSWPSHGPTVILDMASSFGILSRRIRQEVLLQCSRRHVCMVHLIVAITGSHPAPDLLLAAAVALWPCRASGSLCKSRTARKTVTLFTLFDRLQL